MIKWFSPNSNNFVTIDRNSLTLNIEALQFFKDALYVKLGIDEDNEEVIIKKIDCTEAEFYQDSSIAKELFHISIGKTYGRITSTSFIDHIEKTFGSLNLEEKIRLKVPAIYEEDDGILRIKIKEAKDG